MSDFETITDRNELTEKINRVLQLIAFCPRDMEEEAGIKVSHRLTAMKMLISLLGLKPQAAKNAAATEGVRPLNDTGELAENVVLNREERRRLKHHKRQ